MSRLEIQWYPGHMTKARRMIAESLPLVDVVIELLDARVPYSSKNPDIDALAKDKRRVVALNKSDLADPAATARWLRFFTDKGFSVTATDSRSGNGVDAAAELARKSMREKLERQKNRGRLFAPIRAMIVGIPNVGKSAFINRTTGSTAAKTADRPGVTRGRQWIRLRKDFELLDTPGILWPKFDDPDAGMKLACCGAIGDNALETTEIAVNLISLLLQIKPEALQSRYKIELANDGPWDILEKIAVARKLLLKAGQLDLERTAIILLDEFRGGRLGRITLEEPEQMR